MLAQDETGAPDLANPRQPDWPEADFIVGNPPFIGAKYIREELGSAYAEALWRINSNVPASADFVMQWWDRAAVELTRPDSRLRRFGFVTTNSITQSFSRRVIEGHLANPPRDGEVASRSDDRGGSPSAAPPPKRLLHPSPAASDPSRRVGEDRRGLHLVLACPDHPWTKATKDAAAVRIAMTVAEAGAGEGVLLEVEHEANLDTDTPELSFAPTHAPINANLTVGADPSAAQPLRSNNGLASRGVTLFGAGFIISPAEAQALGLGRRAGLEKHVRPYVNGRDLLQRSRGAMVIDLFGLTEVKARRSFPEVYQHLFTVVKPARDENRRASYRNRWWVFGEPRRELRSALADLKQYIVTPVTSKHTVFLFVDGDVVPDDALIAVGSDDPFHLGSLSSRIHVQWSLRAGGWLGIGNDPRYTNSRVFDPFPFPDPTPDQRTHIAELAEELDATRKTALAEVPRLTMTELYNLRERIAAGETLTGADLARATAARAFIVHQLHEEIDRAVAAAYGWPADLPPSEIVARLVSLNAERKAEEAAGHIRWLRPDYQIPRFGKDKE